MVASSPWSGVPWTVFLACSQPLAPASRSIALFLGMYRYLRESKLATVTHVHAFRASVQPLGRSLLFSLVGHTIWRGASRGGHEAPLLCVVRSPTTSGHRLVCRQHFVREVTWIVASSAALALPMSALPLEHWQCQCRARRGTRRRRSVIDMSHGRTWPIPVSRSALAGHWAHVAVCSALSLSSTCQQCCVPAPEYLRRNRTRLRPRHTPGSISRMCSCS